MEQPNLSNPRLRALQQLQTQMPQANQQVANQQSAARDIQLQNTVKSAPASTPTTGGAQAAGTGTAQNAGQQMIKQAATNVKQQGQLGETGIQASSTEAARQLGEQKIGLENQKTDNVQRLANLDARAKKELYDDQMQFQKDENNRALLNDVQLSDYAKLNADRGEAYKNYQQTVQQATQRKMEYMQNAYNILEQQMNNEYAKAKQAGDQEMMQQIENNKVSMSQRMEREKAMANNKSAEYGAGGTVIGGVAGAIVGGIYGGPGGAAAGGAGGAAIGGGVGSYVGNL